MAPEPIPQKGVKKDHLSPPHPRGTLNSPMIMLGENPGLRISQSFLYAYSAPRLRGDFKNEGREVIEREPARVPGKNLEGPVFPAAPRKTRKTAGIFMDALPSMSSQSRSLRGAGRCNLLLIFSQKLWGAIW